MQLFVRDLTAIDASFLDSERGVVGDSWIVDVLLEGELDQQSMVLDFGDVKRTIKQAIDELVDHKLLVPTQAAGLSLHHNEQRQRSWVDFVATPGSFHFNVPEQALALLDSVQVDESSIIAYLHQQLLARLPDNVGELTLTLRKEVIAGSAYHYTHGLKKHAGNCQRIAHGHRSTIDIEMDGKRRVDCEHYWADRWEDIYLGSQEDIVEVTQLELTEHGRELVNLEHVAFSYTASQGLFEIALPGHRCEVLTVDTTVECLAEYICQETAAMLNLNDEHGRLRVAAYEGIGKGAISEMDM